MFGYLLTFSRYTSKMLLAAVDENLRGTYDFLYLPIDFKVIHHDIHEYIFPDLYMCLRDSCFYCRIDAMWAMHLSICCLHHTSSHSMRYTFMLSYKILQINSHPFL